MTRQEIETALDNGNLWARMQGGRLWKLRRNGKTQTWKTQPDDFRIPVKAGLRSTGQLTETSEIRRDESGETSGALGVHSSPQFIVERA